MKRISDSKDNFIKRAISGANDSEFINCSSLILHLSFFTKDVTSTEKDYHSIKYELTIMNDFSQAYIHSITLVFDVRIKIRNVSPFLGKVSQITFLMNYKICRIVES